MGAAGFAAWAGILLARMLAAPEAARQIFDLPALFGACLLALDTTAGTGALLGTQLVHARGDREIFKVRQIAPPPAPPPPPQLFFWFCVWRKIVRVDCLALQPFGKL